MSKDWKNELVITGACYTGVLFYTFLYYYWAEEYYSLYQSLHHVGTYGFIVISVTFYITAVIIRIIFLQCSCFYYKFGTAT